MLLWEPGQLAAVQQAVDDARSGRPSVLLVEGGAGAGKTSLLNETLTLAENFRVFAAEGGQTGSSPFGVLHQWGVDALGSSEGRAVEPFAAAQGLRRLGDAQDDGAWILLLDDLQWADPESVEALTWLLRRSAGDRLLVALGTRPLSPDAHVGLQRWIAGNQGCRLLPVRAVAGERVRHDQPPASGHRRARTATAVGAHERQSTPPRGLAERV